MPSATSRSSRSPVPEILLAEGSEDSSGVPSIDGAACRPVIIYCCTLCIYIYIDFNIVYSKTS